MANPEHLERLKQGVEVWNDWVRHNRINDEGSSVRHDGAQVGVSGFWADLKEADLRGIDLYQGQRGAGFSGIDLAGADLRDANLWHANLAWARLIGATLERAEMSHATLANADLSGTNLIGANLTSANISGVDFLRANLLGANFTGAYLYETIFSDTDLTNAVGLDSCLHDGPSTVDHRTLTKSGALPLNFLRGCGLPDVYINYIPSLIDNPIQFYSCFISYSSKDQEFAERLYADLQNKGVRCWFAPEDLKIGDRFRDKIDESIRLHDKLLVILSENSVSSQWVSDEVEAAIEQEHREGRTVLFPIKIDEAVTESEQAWAASIRRARHIGDFTRWKDHDGYQKAFDRLLRDLKAEENNKLGRITQDSLMERAVLSPRNTLIEGWKRVQLSVIQAAKRKGLANEGELVDCGLLINQLYGAGMISEAVREEYFFLSRWHRSVALTSLSTVEPGAAIDFVNRAGELQKALAADTPPLR